MKIQLIHVVMAAMLCLSFVDKVNAGRRRPKCYIRLCIKCSMFVNSRYKRSLSDGENEFDTAEDFEVDNADRLHKHKAGNLRWTDRYSQQVDAILKSEERDEFDVASANIHSTDKPPASPKSKDTVQVHSPKTHAKRQHRKRSSSSLERCIYLLNTKCCRAYFNVATYIGYKLRH